MVDTILKINPTSVKPDEIGFLGFPLAILSKNLAEGLSVPINSIS